MTRRDDGLPQPRKPAFAWLSQRISERVFLLNQHRRQRRVRHLRQPLRDRAALLEAVRDKRLVFTVTAGRTGTTYLTHLLALCPDTTSLHEPEPSFVPVLRLVQRDPQLARRFLLEYKLPFIADVPTPPLRRDRPPALQGLPRAAARRSASRRSVIAAAARRRARVARSLLSRRTVPGRGKLGLKYLLHPADPGVLPLPRWTGASPTTSSASGTRSRSSAASAATARRSSRRAARWVDVTAEELHDRERFIEVTEQLGLLDARVDRETLLRRHAEVSGRLYNYNRRPPAVVVTPDLAEEAVWHAITPAAPWLRAAIERRYAPAAEVTPLAASRS